MQHITIGSTVAAVGVSLALLVSGCSADQAGPTPTSTTTTVDPSNAAVELTPEIKSRLQEVLDGIIEEFDVPGIQVGVWSGDQTWIGTAGVAKAGTSQTISMADHTRIGSITKTMTATVILQLIEQGKVSFDDILDTYVPGMPNGSTATIRNLLEMQSGIPPYTAEPTVVDKYSADPTQTFTPQELVNAVKSADPVFAPGEQFQYSNTNYVLLGMIIEKVTGKSITDTFRERLYRPLKMAATKIPGTSTAIPQPYLSGISEQADPIGKVKDATNWNPSFAFTAGEAISTIEDLHTWGVALATGKGILSPDTQQLRLASVNTTVPPNTPERSYGMGIVNTAGWLGHTGEIPGYNTVLNHDPATGTTVVVMVNSDIPNGPEEQPVAPGVSAFQAIAQVLSPGAPAAPQSSSAASSSASSE